MIVADRRASTIIFSILRGVRRCGKFLLPANVCPIVPLVFMKAEREFEFVDVSLTTLCMDIGRASSRIARDPEGIAGLVYVRTYGATRDVDTWFSEVKSSDPSRTIIDDRCLCPPADFEASRGSADAVMWSTGHAKYVDLGFGGYGLISDDLAYVPYAGRFRKSALEEVTAQYKRAIEMSMPFTYTDSEWLEGGGLPIPEQDYVSMVRESARQASVHKQALNSIYAKAIPIEGQLPAEFQNWRFNVLVAEKERLVAEIFRQGLFASSHYAPLQRVGAGDTPVAAAVYRRVVNLFNDRYMDEPGAHRVAAIVREHVARYGVGDQTGTP